MEARVIDTIIFDCFGVLYTDSKSSVRGLVPADKQQELTDLYTRNDYGYITQDEFFNELALLSGQDKEELFSYMRKEHSLNLPLKRMIIDHFRGTYRIGLLSNIGRGWINNFFDEHELHELFDEVVLSSEVHLTKPDPAIFQLTADKLGSSTATCLMIDDIEENCQGAISSGMHAIQFVSNDQLLEDLNDLRLV